MVKMEELENDIKIENKAKEYKSVEINKEIDIQEKDIKNKIKIKKK